MLRIIATITLFLALAGSATASPPSPEPHPTAKGKLVRTHGGVDYITWTVSLPWQNITEQRTFRSACWRPSELVRWCGYRWVTQSIPRQKVCFVEVLDEIRTRLCIRVVPR